MRLNPTQIDTIYSTAQAVLGESAKVTLFGSGWMTTREAAMRT
jgi:hypothetical protein